MHSTNHHGVHSPFVYQLITKCIYNQNKDKEYALLNQYRSELYSDKMTIEVEDFGKGSRVFKHTTREINKIARHVGVTKSKQQLIYRLSEYVQTKNSLELGTSLGMGSIALSRNHHCNVTTIEGCNNTAEVAKKYFKKYNFKTIELRQGTFEWALTDEQKKIWDLVFFDGNHTYSATMSYFNLLLKSKHNNSIFIFDDIYISKEMTLAWNEIKKNKQVSVSIDLFHLGLVFFRNEQPKQDFKIRM